MGANVNHAQLKLEHTPARRFHLHCDGKNKLFILRVVVRGDLRVRREFWNLENAFNLSVRNDDGARHLFTGVGGIPKRN